jgi:hypothetical protein
MSLLEYILKFDQAIPNTANWSHMMVIVMFVVLDLAVADGNDARFVYRLVSLKSSSSPKIHA